MKPKIAMAVGAHPDDIEFMMAGTLLLLRKAGFETHYLNIANGSCGGDKFSGPKTAAIRKKESRAAAKVLGAVYHPSLVDDLDIYYGDRTLRKLAAVMRDVKPEILLVPSPVDYMEDHTNACRLAVSAAFVRGMRNFKTMPARAPVDADVTVYHAMPHGLRDPLRKRIIPGSFVNVTPVFDEKIEALGRHKSQQSWLEVSQKMNAYLRIMESFARQIGSLSKKFRYAEGWRRRLHYGFCPEKTDPLAKALGRNYLINRAYERELEMV